MFCVKLTAYRNCQTVPVGPTNFDNNSHGILVLLSIFFSCHNEFLWFLFHQQRFHESILFKWNFSIACMQAILFASFDYFEIITKTKPNEMSQQTMATTEFILPSLKFAINHNVNYEFFSI